MSNPSISIIIPTINRYNDLRNTIQDLNKQSVTDFEIIIVDQTDRTLFQDIVGGNIIHLHGDFKSASKARNLGLLTAKAPVSLFLDDDVIIENIDFIKNHLNHYKHKETSGVAGAILEIDRKWIEKLPEKTNHKYLGWLYKPRNYNKLSRNVGGGSGNLSVRTTWAIEIGGMDENFEKGAYREESDFCFRYTKKYGLLVFDPKAYLVHIGNPSGGIRSWKSSKGIIHPTQHMFGTWYFMFRNLPWFTWHIYIWLTIRRFILHKKLFAHFYLLPKALFWFIYSFFKAFIKSLKERNTIKTN
jgi:glycosyltransferase involved in cell wall biosynthesis